MIEVQSFNNLTWAGRLSFRQFCAQAGESKDPAAHNMLYLHGVMDRFTNRGTMMIAADEGRIVACSGAYFSDFSPDVALLGARTWVMPAYRNRQIVRDLLLPAQRDWVIEREAKQVALTFNEYNRNLIALFERQIVKRVPRSPRHLFHKNMNVLPYRVMIQYVPQWVVYEQLDPDFEFDWMALEETRVIDKLNAQQ